MNEKSKNLNVFVSGILRSGTTLVCRSLSAHPLVNIAYQPFTPFFKIWRNLYLENAGNDTISPDSPRGTEYLFSEEQREHFKDFSMVTAVSEDVIQQIEREIINNLQHEENEKPQSLQVSGSFLKPGKAGFVLDQLFELIGDSDRNCSVYGFKETWCEEFMIPMLKRDRTKVIHIIRDPRAVIASRNYGKYLESCDNWKYPILFLTKTWLRSLHYNNLLKGNDSYMMIRYEDLVLHTGATLSRLSEFLDVSFDEDMTNPEKYTSGNGRSWIPNSTSVQERKINRKPLEYWKTTLSENEKGAIEYLCGEEMKRLGYELSSPGSCQDLFKDYEEDTSRIISWLNKKPYLLDREMKSEIIRKRKLHEKS